MSVFKTSGTARFALLAIAVVVLTVSKSLAAPYPDRPIHIIHPFAAGGGSDAILRIVAQELSQSTGMTFVVENKTGAGGRIGYAAGAKAVPDGYTLVTLEIHLFDAPRTFRRIVKLESRYRSHPGHHVRACADGCCGQPKAWG